MRASPSHPLFAPITVEDSGLTLFFGGELVLSGRRAQRARRNTASPVVLSTRLA